MNFFSAKAKGILILNNCFTCVGFNSKKESLTPMRACVVGVVFDLYVDHILLHQQF
jgi:hypothetical protein